jgi:hypothetical protein
MLLFVFPAIRSTENVRDGSSITVKLLVNLKLFVATKVRKYATFVEVILCRMQNKIMVNGRNPRLSFCLVIMVSADTGVRFDVETSFTHKFCMERFYI